MPVRAQGHRYQPQSNNQPKVGCSVRAPEAPVFQRSIPSITNRRLAVSQSCPGGAGIPALNPSNNQPKVGCSVHPAIPNPELAAVRGTGIPALNPINNQPKVGCSVRAPRGTGIPALNPIINQPMVGCIPRPVSNPPRGGVPVSQPQRSNQNTTPPQGSRYKKFPSSQQGLFLKHDQNIH